MVSNATTQGWIWPLIICQIEQSKNLYTNYFITNMVCKFDQIKLVYTFTQCHSQCTGNINACMHEKLEISMS
jgi:hypothetical protein